MLRSVFLGVIAAVAAWLLWQSAEQLHGRVVVVADLHGDFEHALAVLRMAGVVAPDSHKWAGGKTVLVSTGDLVDRGDDTIPLYKLFASLRSESHAAGGRVVQLFGNHEIMNLLGDWRYVTQGDVASFGGVHARRAAMKDGWIGHEWQDNYAIAARIPLISGSLPEGYDAPAIGLSHAGIAPQFAALGLEAINEHGASMVRKVINSHDINAIAGNLTKEERTLYSDSGPLWYRGYALDDEEVACVNAYMAAEMLDVRHLVMGHTPQMDGFLVRCGGHLLVIDTGISRAYGGKQSALVFDTTLTLGETWVEKSIVTALYLGSEPETIGVWERSRTANTGTAQPPPGEQLPPEVQAEMV